MCDRWNVTLYTQVYIRRGYVSSPYAMRRRRCDAINLDNVKLQITGRSDPIRSHFIRSDLATNRVRVRCQLVKCSIVSIIQWNRIKSDGIGSDRIGRALSRQQALFIPSANHCLWQTWIQLSYTSLKVLVRVDAVHILLMNFHYSHCLLYTSDAADE